MSQGEHPFFERLAALENTPEVLAAFDRFVNRPLDISASGFFATLFGTLVDRLIDLLNLPASPGAAMREWRDLYGMGAAIDPYYHTKSQIISELAKCPPMSESQRESLTGVLQGYFRLRRDGFPAGFPSSLVSELDWRRWHGIFPERFAWESVEMLQAAGMYAVGGRAGARAHARYTEGDFEPKWSTATLENWYSACSGGSQAGRDEAFAHRRDFLAGVFAGDFESLGLSGWCGPAPHCGGCPLGAECRWAASPTKTSMGRNAVLGRLNQGRKSHLGTGQLLQGVLGLEGAAAEVLDEKLRKISLRRLAAMTWQELEDWLEDVPVAPEQMEGLLELGKRLGEERLEPGVILQSGRDVFNHYRMRLRDVKQEQFLVVLLDSRRRFLADVMVSQGTLNTSPVHPREVFNHAIRERAASVMIAHNHPSGDPTPSKDDINITHRLLEAGKLIGIPLVDHIIIAGDDYISFVELNLL